MVYYRFYTNWYDADSTCSKDVASFIGCVNNNNNVDVSVYQGEVKQKSCGTLQLTYGLEQSDQIYTLICNSEGDTVKLSKTEGPIKLYEVAVTGEIKGKVLNSVSGYGEHFYHPAFKECIPLQYLNFHLEHEKLMRCNLKEKEHFFAY